MKDSGSNSILKRKILDFLTKLRLEREILVIEKQEKSAAAEEDNYRKDNERLHAILTDK